MLLVSTRIRLVRLIGKTGQTDHPTPGQIDHPWKGGV